MYLISVSRKNFWLQLGENNNNKYHSDMIIKEKYFIINQKWLKKIIFNITNS